MSKVSSMRYKLPVSNRAIALSEALLTTFLWSSSYVLIKRGLVNISPLLFAGSRYFLAFLCLLTVLLLTRKTFPSIEMKEWVYLACLGLSGYAGMPAFQFLGLLYLDATDSAFISNFNPLFVALVSWVVKKKSPRKIQWAGFILSLIGATVYFFPEIDLGSANKALGMVFTAISGLFWGIYMVLAEKRTSEGLDVLTRTTISMGLGSAPLLLLSFVIEGTRLAKSSWIYIAWLGIVNTALAFTLWIHSLEELKAFETAVLQNTMLIQIALLSMLFLAESLSSNKIIGMIFVLTGAILAQKRTKNNT